MKKAPDKPLGFPVDVTKFELFQPNHFYYADKTDLLRQLARAPKPYFLSRPRRFAKTLLVDALELILQSREASSEAKEGQKTGVRR